MADLPPGMQHSDLTNSGLSYSYSPLYKRQCVDCPQQVLTCPATCPRNQICVQVSQSCTQCSSRQCGPDTSAGARVSSGGGPNVGAIVGGVVGGIIFITLCVWLVWRFYLKKRRAQWQEKHGNYSDDPTLADGELRSRRSMASTTYTRGSNVIQIAFIPGVTDRSQEPPVPPVPSAMSPYSDGGGDHYFMPGDLRDSTYSGFTDSGSSIGRRSVARSIAASIAPSLLRQSVASAVYHEAQVQDAVAARGRANVVSVRPSTTGGSSTMSVPAVPKIDRARFGGSAAGSRPGTAQTAQTHVASPLALPPHVTSDAASDAGFSVNSAGEDVRAAIEEAAMRAARQPTHGGLGSVRARAATATGTGSSPLAREPSPFSDANRISETPEAEAEIVQATLAVAGRASPAASPAAVPIGTALGEPAASDARNDEP